MSADATINIDVMLSNLPKFKTDVSFVDDVLTKLGMNTGSKIDDSFKAETAKVTTIAKSTKKDVDQTFDKPVKFTIKADNSDAEKDVKETKAFLKGIPKSKITELKADNDGASLKIKATKEGISKIPSRKETILNADASQAKTETKDLGDTAEKTESKFISLKDKLSIGAIAGVSSQALQILTGSFSDLIGETTQSSDAMDKFKSTMQFAGFTEKETKEAAKFVKKYADDTVYELSDISNTTAQLAANGIGNYQELTEAAGNLNAVAGGNAETFKSVAMMLTQTAGAGKLTTENWNQMADAIPGASGKMQEAMKNNGAFTGNFRDAMEEGQISAEEFSKAIVDLGMTDVAEEAAKSTKTFEGAMGNLQANIVTKMNEIVDGIGKDKLTDIISFISDNITKLFDSILKGIDYLNDNQDKLSSIFDNLKKISKIFFGAAWDAVLDIIKKLTGNFSLLSKETGKTKDPLQRFDDVLSALSKHEKGIALLGKALATLFIAKKIVGVVSAFGKLLDIFGGTALLSSPIFLIPAAIAGIGFAFYKAYKTSKPFREFIDGIVDAVKNFVEVSLKKIKSFFKNVTEGFVEFKDSVTDKVTSIKKSIKKVFNSVIDFFKEDWKEVLTFILNPIAGVVALLYKHNKKFKKWVDDLLDTIKDGLKAFKKKVLDPPYDAITDLIDKIAKTFSKWMGKIEKALEKAGKKLGKATEVIFWLIYGPIRLLGRKIKKGFDEVAEWIEDKLEKAGKAVGKVVDKISSTIKKIFNSLSKSVKKSMELFTEYVIEPVDSVRKKVVKTISNLVDKVVDFFVDLVNITKHKWREIKSSMEKPVDDAKENVSKTISRLKEKIAEIFERIQSVTKSAWNTIKRYTIEPIEDAYEKVVKKVGKIYSGVSKYWNDLKDKTKEKFDEIVDYVKKVPGRIGDAFRDGKEAIGDGIKAAAQYMIDILKKGVNGVIGGINWVLEKVDAPDSVRIDEWKPKDVAKFATGGIHQGGLMLVNDGEGEELVRHPDGRMEIPKGKNVLMHAEAGTQVLNHSQTKSFAEAFGIPMYAKGNVSNLGDFFKSAWNGIKDIGSDILDAVQHPVEFVKKAISEHVNFDATHPVFYIATGGVKKVTNGVMDWIKDKIASFGSIGGSFDGAMADNVYKYLVDIANQTVSKFGMSGITSGYRPGDPYYHGKHQAIDIAYPAGMNGSSKYFDPANWVFEHFADKVGYVITQGKVRDRTGQSGQPATGNWETWPDNDHYDHLHITGKLGSGDIYKAGEGGGKGSPTGSGVARWTSQLKEALRMNGLPTTASYVNAWLRQIETESGGNERAVQPGIDPDGDGSGPAMGLIQAKKGTFLANAFPGHGNIFNGFDSMLAGIRYALKRYGPDMLAVIGHGHGYSNGGEVFGPELAMFGEDPAYPYEININPAKPSADMLIQKAIVARERYKPAVQTNQAVYSNQHPSGGNEHKTMSKKDIETLVQALNERPVRVESILDGKKVSKSVDEYTGSSLARKLYTRGKNFNG